MACSFLEKIPPHTLAQGSRTRKSEFLILLDVTPLICTNIKNLIEARIHIIVEETDPESESDSEFPPSILDQPDLLESNKPLHKYAVQLYTQEGRMRLPYGGYTKSSFDRFSKTNLVIRRLLGPHFPTAVFQSVDITQKMKIAKVSWPSYPFLYPEDTTFHKLRSRKKITGSPGQFLGPDLRQTATDKSSS